MPTTLLGVAFYVFALFPGVAFLFAREGHRPVGKRSALRESATVVFVSTICDAVVGALFILAAIVWPDVRSAAIQILSGDSSWLVHNFPLASAIALGSLTAATLLGLLFGSKWAHEAGLKLIWRSEIPRDVSAWENILHPDQNVEVRVGLNLKSGTWISGTLYDFDNDPDSNPHRAITLNRDIRIRPSGEENAAELEATDWVVVEAGEIEVLQVAYYEPSTQPSPPVLPEPARSSKITRPLLATAVVIVALGGVFQIANAAGLDDLANIGRWLSISGLMLALLTGTMSLLPKITSRRRAAAQSGGVRPEVGDTDSTQPRIEDETFDVNSGGTEVRTNRDEM